MTELKACPFCGGEATRETDGTFKVIVCSNYECGAEVNSFKTWEKAIEAWNRRAE